MGRCGGCGGEGYGVKRVGLKGGKNLFLEGCLLLAHCPKLCKCRIFNI
jgi:hypothetical protein